MATLAAPKPENNNSHEVTSVKSADDNTATDPPTTLSPLEGNGFTIIRKIGTGSYSKVKLAYSKNHKAMVAIKVVSKYHVPEEFLRKFLYNEIKVVKFLKHENIIKYYQSLETSHRLYVIMQHAANGSILDLIHKEKRLSEPRSCHLFRQIMAAVAYCHSQQVAHRDLKCENILLDDKFTVKLIDFGFAKCFKNVPKSPGEEKLEALLNEKNMTATKAEKDSRLSETYCGSYAYASPEILKGTPYDPFLSDIWAMGCVLFAMVYGRLPFDDRDPSKLIRQVQSPLNFPTSIDTSEEVKSTLKKMLAPLKLRNSIERMWEDPWIAATFKDYVATTSTEQMKATSSSQR